MPALPATVAVTTTPAETNALHSDLVVNRGSDRTNSGATPRLKTYPTSVNVLITPVANPTSTLG